MTVTKKILLGIATFIPIICLVLYIVLFFSMFTGVMHIADYDAPEEHIFKTYGNMVYLFILIAAMILFGLGIMIFYLIHAIRNKHFNDTEKLIWILVIVLANTLGSIVYFFVIIVPSKPLTVAGNTDIQSGQ